MTERASDSDGSEVGLSAAADEEVVEIGSDLDEDMSHDEPTPRQADNSAEPTTAPVATDEAEEKLLPYTEDDVSYWKTRAERSLAQKEAMSGESESSVEAISNSIDPLPEEAPF